MKDVRHDTKRDAAVNKGLAAALLVDVPAGVKIMSDGGVPSEVITRVINNPQRRRATDWNTSQSFPPVQSR
jgi:hypothetical protein